MNASDARFLIALAAVSVFMGVGSLLAALADTRRIRKRRRAREGEEMQQRVLDLFTDAGYDPDDDDTQVIADAYSIVAIEQRRLMK